MGTWLAAKLGEKAAGQIMRFGPYVAVALVFALILTLTYCAGGSAKQDEIEAERLEQAIEFLEGEREAYGHAADEAVADNNEIRDQEEELEDARTTPGDDAYTRRIRSLCVKLRQQQAPEHSACARFNGGNGAADTE